MTDSKKTCSCFPAWVKTWLPLLLYTAYVFWGALMPSDDVPSFLWGINDKLLHSIQYALMAILAFHAFSTSGITFLIQREMMASTLYSSIVGVVTEWLQSFTQDRHAEMADVLANFLGISVGLILVRWFWRNKKS